jgi:putative membrane protein insertion efficiency factor
MATFFCILFVLASIAISADGACQSCLMDLTVSGLTGHRVTREEYAPSNGVYSSAVPVGLAMNHRPINPGSPVISKGFRPTPSLNPVDSSAIRFLALRKLISVAYDRASANAEAATLPPSAGTLQMSRRWAGGLFIEELSESDDTVQETNEEEKNELADAMGGDEVMSGSMIMAIGFYKKWISPLLPPACRFLPTCSQYGVQAIKEFGPQKGLILTAWRLARCSPFGGRGYDPPKWPPVAYTYGSY